MLPYEASIADPLNQLRCGMPNCPKGEYEYQTADKLGKHLRSKHETEFPKADPQKLDNAIKNYKVVFW